MKAVFPGKPQARLQACDTALWEGRRILTYISQNALIVLGGPDNLIQTTLHNETDVLEAVAISETTGKIATCTNKTVYVYKPFGQDVGHVNWSLQHTLIPSRHDSSLSNLSWGLPEELLVAGSSLTILDTGNVARETWSRELANPAKFASFTPDAGFIATTGQYDRLIKIWRREFLGGEEEEERFDVSYLAHPSTVTSLRWHRRSDQDHHSDTVLYTTCGDSKLRIWAATDHHALQALELWAELDMNECILPRSPLPPSIVPRYFVFVIDGWEFEAMVEDSIHQGLGGEREKHAREHLSDVAYRDPDVCVIMDDRGNMSAWGLERVGCKARQPNDIFNIVLAEGVNFIPPNQDEEVNGAVCFCNFAGIKDGRFNVLTNMFNGTIEWLSSSVDRFFDTSLAVQRFQTEAIWTGHAEPIQSLICSTSNRCLLSIGFQDEVVAWTQNPDGDLKTALTRQTQFASQKAKPNACLLFDDRIVAFASQSNIEFWNLENATLVLESHELEQSLYPTCLVWLPRAAVNSDDGYLVSIGNTLHGAIWRVSQHGNRVSFELLNHFDLPKDSEGHVFKATRPGDSRDGATFVVYSVEPSGSLTLWTASVDPETARLTLKRRGRALTGVQDPAMTQVSIFGTAAVVSSDQASFTIWDLRLGHLEFQATFRAHEAIQAIDILSTSGQGAILAVAFSHKTLIYVQDRFDPSSQNPAWLMARAIDIGSSTNIPISDCVWTKTHDLVLAAGNQMFVFDNRIDVPNSVISSTEFPAQHSLDAPLQSVTTALNSVPAIYSPSVFVQILLTGKVETVDRIFNALRQKLKFWSPGDEFDSQLDISSLNDFQKLHEDLSETDSTSAEDALEVFSQDTAAALNNIIESIDLPYLAMEQKAELVDFGESLGFFENNRRAVDNLAIRYLLNLHLLTKRPPKSRPPISWRDITFASHTVSQDVIVELTSRLYEGRMLWRDARECGMFMWLSDIEAVRAQFENIARNEYTKTDERNPIDCSLYYLALKKKQILVGLWRMATWNREQSATLRLLGNNFNDPRWKTAAQKNAYALLGLRRFEYAAAFFLLADCLKDAVSVLVSQLGDVQLAFAVARVHEGDDGPIVQQLLREKILPQAAREGNRWLATLAFWHLKQKDRALRALTDPLDDLIKPPSPSPMLSKHYRNNEPALAHFYRFLRDKVREDPREGVVVVSQQAEWDLVMRSALSYVRGGCHILALDLVQNWKFTYAPPPAGRNGTTALDVQTSEKHDEKSQVGHDSAVKPQEADRYAAGGGKMQRKKVTEEPSAASILDNFNF